VRIKLGGVELSKSIPGEACGIVDEQARWWEPGRGRENPIRASGIGEVSDGLDRAFRRLVGLLMDVPDYGPAIFYESARNVRADTLA